MLHGRDRERLEQIEQALRAEDPTFTAHFRKPHHSGLFLGHTWARTLGIVMVLAALLALDLGEEMTFSAAAVLVLCLVLLGRGWAIRAD